MRQRFESSRRQPTKPGKEKSESDRNKACLVVYWCQEGHHLWNAEDEQTAQWFGVTKRWVTERPFAARSAAYDGRLVVLIQTDQHGGLER